MKIRQIFLHTREQFQGTTPLVQMKIRPSKSSFPPPNENSTKQIRTSFPLKGLKRFQLLLTAFCCLNNLKFLQSKLDLLNFATVIPKPNFQRQRFDSRIPTSLILSFQFEAFLPDFLVSINSKYICKRFF
jgi:hypothetical protein